MTVDNYSKEKIERLILASKLYNFGNSVTSEFLEEKFKLMPTYDQKYPNKLYYFLPAIEDAKVSNQWLLSFLKQFNSLYTLFQRGEDAVLQFNKKTQIVFLNTSYKDAIPYLKSNPEEFTHTLSIKTAEFHTYLELQNTITNQTITIGGAPKVKGSKFDYIGLRNDSYYNPKYHVGHKAIHPDHLNPHFNKGSIAIKFPIISQQAIKVVDLVKTYNHDFKNLDHRFDITGHFGVNCADISNKVMNELSIDGKVSDYYKTDELDLRDQGVMYLVWSDLGTIKFAYYMPYHFIDNLSYVFFGKGIDQVSEYLGSKLWYYNFISHPISPLIPAAYRGDVSAITSHVDKINIPNAIGETPLHIALQNEEFYFADMLFANGADINAKDDKGFTPLHIVAGLVLSDMKLNVLKSLCGMVKDVNTVDSTGSVIPLTNAVLSDDSKAVDILINCGANASYINGNGDSIIDIALFNSKFKTLDLIHEHDPSLIYRDNQEHQIPICVIAEQKNPSEILPDFEILWAKYDQSNCKDHSELNAHLDIDSLCI